MGQTISCFKAQALVQVQVQVQVHALKENEDLKQRDFKNLQHLPTELLLEIALYLRPSSVMSMSYVCRQIRYNMGVSIQEQCMGQGVFRHEASGTNIIRRATWHSERLELLCMLERDHLIPRYRSICSICRTTHPRSFFSADALRHESRTRSCLGSVGRVWIAPDIIISFDQLKSYANRHDSYLCHRDCWNTASPCSFNPMFDWPLVHAFDGSMPSNSTVADVLSTLDAYICPHWQLRDPIVLNQYDENCQRLRLSPLHGRSSPRCDCRVCMSPLDGCSLCGAQIHYKFRTDSNGKGRTLFVVARRDLKNYGSLTDWSWIEQLNYPEEYDSLTQAWEQTVRRCEYNLKTKFSPYGGEDQPWRRFI